jgi:1-deoxy-D-xylulose 5-phosphate reductoisomerase
MVVQVQPLLSQVYLQHMLEVAEVVVYQQELLEMAVRVVVEMVGTALPGLLGLQTPAAAVVVEEVVLYLKALAAQEVLVSS